MGKLDNKVAVVTGATSGIGIGIVNSLVHEGARVVFCGRREDKGLAVEKEFKDQGFDVTFVKTDVTKEEDINLLIQKTLDLHNNLDIWVNNAGVISNFSILQLNSEYDYDRVFDINIKSQFVTINKVAKVMATKGGSIVNIASIAGLNGQPYLSAYGASKAASISLTRSMAKELAPMNIRVNGVLPGPIFSEMLIRGSENEEYCKASVPMGRCGEPSEIGSTVAFLVSDEASFITGVNIAVDGGASA